MALRSSCAQAVRPTALLHAYPDSSNNTIRGCLLILRERLKAFLMNVQKPRRARLWLILHPPSSGIMISAPAGWTDDDDEGAEDVGSVLWGIPEIDQTKLSFSQRRYHTRLKSPGYRALPVVDTAPFTSEPDIHYPDLELYESPDDDQYFVTALSSPVIQGKATQGPAEGTPLRLGQSEVPYERLRFLLEDAKSTSSPNHTPPSVSYFSPPDPPTVPLTLARYHSSLRFPEPWHVSEHLADHDRNSGPESNSAPEPIQPDPDPDPETARLR